MATLSIFDPITNGYINLDGGASSVISVEYQILVELRTMNVLMQQLVAQTSNSDDLTSIRADSSVADSTFVQAR